MTMNLTAAVVGETASVRNVVRSVLKERGHAVREFTSIEAFFDFLDKNACDMVFVHHHSTGATGLRLLHYVRQTPGLEKLPVVVCSGDNIRYYVERDDGIFSGMSLTVIEHAVGKAEDAARGMNR